MEWEPESVFIKEEILSDDSSDEQSKLEENRNYRYEGDFIAEDFLQVKLVEKFKFNAEIVLSTYPYKYPEITLNSSSIMSSSIQFKELDDENDEPVNLKEVGEFNNLENQPLDLKAVSIVQSVHSNHLQRNKGDIQLVPNQEEVKNKRHRRNKRPEYYICEFCGKNFKNNSHYHRHVRLHTTGRSHKCEQCGKFYTSKETLIAHIKCHTKREHDPVTCPVCQMVYKNSDSFRRHYRRRHVNAGTFQCSFCDKICNTKEAIKKHLERHKNVNSKFPCTKCEKVFVEFSKLKLHLQTHDEIYKFTCVQCNKRFIDENNLKVHIKSKHEERPFVCKICNHDFNTLRRLKAHVTLHFKEKKFLCRLCPKAFESKGTLEDHVRLHNGELPFQCEFCGKKFSARKRLRCHMTLQHREQLFSCPFCSMVFVTEKSLETHRDSHKVTEGSHSCKECGKIFLYATYLKQHMKLHKQTEKYECEFCNEQFRHKISIKKHQKKSCKALKGIVSGKFPDEKETKILKEQNDDKSVLETMSESKTTLESNNSMNISQVNVSEQQIKMCDNIKYNSSDNIYVKCGTSEFDNSNENSGAENSRNEEEGKGKNIILKPSECESANVNENINNIYTESDNKEVNFGNEISRKTNKEVSTTVELNNESDTVVMKAENKPFVTYLQNGNDDLNTKENGKFYHSDVSFNETNDSDNFIRQVSSQPCLRKMCESGLKVFSKINNQYEFCNRSFNDNFDSKQFVDKKPSTKTLNDSSLEKDIYNNTKIKNNSETNLNKIKGNSCNELDNLDTLTNCAIKKNKHDIIIEEKDTNKNKKESKGSFKNSDLQSISSVITHEGNYKNKLNEKLEIVNYQESKRGEVEDLNLEQFVNNETTEHNFTSKTEIEYNSLQNSKQVKLNFHEVNAKDSEIIIKDDVSTEETESNLILNNLSKTSDSSDSKKSKFNVVGINISKNNNRNCKIGEMKYKLCDSRNYMNKKDKQIKKKESVEKCANSNNISLVEQCELSKQMLYNSSTSNLTDYGIQQNWDVLAQSDYRTNYNKLTESSMHNQKLNIRNEAQNNLEESRNYNIQQYHKIKAKLCHMKTDSESEDSDTERQIKRIKFKRLE